MSDLEKSIGYGPLIVGQLLISSLVHKKVLFLQISFIIAIQYFSETGAFWWISASIISSLIVGCILLLTLNHDYFPVAKEEVASENSTKNSKTQRLKNLARNIMFASLFNLVSNSVYIFSQSIPQNSVSHLIPSTSLSFIILSNPRSIDLISETLKTLIESIEAIEKDTKSINPFQILIYTSDENHKRANTIKDSHLFWLVKPGPVGRKFHRQHLLSALNAASANNSAGISNSLSEKYEWSPNSIYFAIWEDDFPLCDNISLMKFLKVAWKTHHCGFQVATGGSGLIFPRALLTSLITALETRTTDPVDVVMQKCIQGIYCDVCVFSSYFKPMIVPSMILAKHTGWNASILAHKFPKGNKKECLFY
jgi:archaellum component FlaG (FlaF/FlaG flagellin family)